MTTTTPAAAPSATAGATAKKRTPSTRGRRRPSASRRRSTPLTIAMLAVLAYFLLPLFWLVVASTKSTQDLFNSFGLWFSHAPQLLANIKETFTQDDGVFLDWLLNTVMYAGVSAVGAAVLAAAAGYGFAKFRFHGDRAAFNLVLGAVMVPATALAIPTYLLFAKAELVNTPWAVILPSLVNPFGLYLMRIYAQDAIPDSILEAARIDGAGEGRIFFTIALRLLAPGLVTVLLFTLVATWNNYFLPLIMLNDPNLYPITVGLASWAAQAQNGGAGSSSEMLALVVTGSLSLGPPARHRLPPAPAVLAERAGRRRRQAVGHAALTPLPRFPGGFLHGGSACPRPLRRRVLPRVPAPLRHRTPRRTPQDRPRPDGRRPHHRHPRRRVGLVDLGAGERPLRPRLAPARPRRRPRTRHLRRPRHTDVRRTAVAGPPVPGDHRRAAHRRAHRLGRPSGGRLHPPRLPVPRRAGHPQDRRPVCRPPRGHRLPGRQRTGQRTPPQPRRLPALHRPPARQVRRRRDPQPRVGPGLLVAPAVDVGRPVDPGRQRPAAVRRRLAGVPGTPGHRVHRLAGRHRP